MNKTILSAFFASTALLAACGEVKDSPAHTKAPSYSLLDTNGNGKADAVDLNANRRPDLRLGFECAAPFIDLDRDATPDGVDLDCDGHVDVSWCAEPLIDRDGDDVPEAIDFDCDGDADIDLDLPEVCVPQLVDRNDDDLPEGIDTNCDGTSDVVLDLCLPALLERNGLPAGLDTNCDGDIDVPLACNPIVDTDDDGTPEGLDYDCDGDVDFDPHPGHGR